MLEITTVKSVAKWYFPKLKRISISFEYGDSSVGGERVWNNCIDLMPLTRAKM